MYPGLGLSRSRCFGVRRPLLRKFLRAEQRRNAAIDSAIGGRGKPGLLTTGADFGHDRRKRRRLQRQPLRSQGCRDDFLNSIVEPLPSRAVGPRQQRRHPSVDAIARQQIIDLPDREAQLGGRPIDRRSMRDCLIEDPVEFTRNAARRQPRLLRRRRHRDGCWGLQSLRQVERSLKSVVEKSARFSP